MSTQDLTYTPADQKAFVEEMAQVIEGTHWTKSVLACVHFLYEKDRLGRTKYEEVEVKAKGYWDVDRTVKIPVLATDANGKVMTKPTACLVGIILVVQKGGWSHVPMPELTDDEVENWREGMLEQTRLEDSFIHNLGDDGGDEDEAEKRKSPWYLDETQLNELGHSIIRLLVTELVRTPKQYKVSDSDYRDMESALKFGSAYNVYRCLETWNDQAETTKALARRLCLNTAKQIKE